MKKNVYLCSRFHKEIMKRYTASANRNVGIFYLCRRISVTVHAVLAWACYVSRQKVIPTTPIRRCVHGTTLLLLSFFGVRKNTKLKGRQ